MHFKFKFQRTASVVEATRKVTIPIVNHILTRRANHFEMNTLNTNKSKERVLIANDRGLRNKI